MGNFAEESMGTLADREFSIVDTTNWLIMQRLCVHEAISLTGTT